MAEPRRAAGEDADASSSPHANFPRHRESPRVGARRASLHTREVRSGPRPPARAPRRSAQPDQTEASQKKRRPSTRQRAIALPVFHRSDLFILCALAYASAVGVRPIGLVVLLASAVAVAGCTQFSGPGEAEPPEEEPEPIPHVIEHMASLRGTRWAAAVGRTRPRSDPLRRQISSAPVSACVGLTNPRALIPVRTVRTSCTVTG